MSIEEAGCIFKVKGHCMSSIACIAKLCVKYIKEIHLKIPSQGQVMPVTNAYDRKKIDSINSEKIGGQGR